MTINEIICVVVKKLQFFFNNMILMRMCMDTRNGGDPHNGSGQKPNFVYAYLRLG